MIVLTGEKSIHNMVWIYLRKLFLNNSICVIDCANRFDPYFISKISVFEGKNPYEVLDRIIIARAFTPFQLLKLIENYTSFKNYPLLCIGINSLFEDENISTKYAWKIFRKAISNIEKIDVKAVLTVERENLSRNFLSYLKKRSKIFIQKETVVKPKIEGGDKFLWEGQLHLLAE